jgi:HSP20 family molecular chaperone IbpA
VPADKKKIIEEGKKLEENIISQWGDGLLSDEEKYQKIIEIWTQTKKSLEKVLPENINTEEAEAQMDKGMLTVKIPKVTEDGATKKDIQES